MDLLANLYNSNTPAKLKLTKHHVAGMIKEAGGGPGVDLDTLLMCLVYEHVRGRCPVDAMLEPRYVTDGSLPSAVNYAGGWVQGVDRERWFTVCMLPLVLFYVNFYCFLFSI